MICPGILVVSAEEQNVVYEYEINGNHVTVTFDDNNFTPEQEKKIADDLAYGESEVSTCGILCIFGHDYEISTGYRTEHKVLEFTPRCEQTVYNVSTCTRCDKQVTEIAYVHMIDCCPED